MKNYKKIVGFCLLCILMIPFGFALPVFAGEMTTPSSAFFYVDGKEVTIDGYLIHGKNYYQIRELAQILKGTKKEFQVEWDDIQKAIIISSSKAYTSTKETKKVEPKKNAKEAMASVATIDFDGVKKKMNGYFIDDYYYFGLRDVMEALDIEVLWSEKKKAIYLNTNESQQASRKLTPQEIYDRCSPAVFQIETYDMEGDALSRGSGFVLQENGIAVTNFHVLQDCFDARAYFTDGTECKITKVLGYDPKQDWVVMQLEEGNYTYLNLGDSQAMVGGQKIFTIGSPLGLSNTISEGLISNPNRYLEGQRYVQISAPISSGSSGGALLNEYGEVIGITTAGYDVGQNLNFAIPMTGAAAVLEKKESISLEEMSRQWEITQYQELPEAFEEIYEEEEPNDILEESTFLPNGVTMLGEIDDDYLDSYYAMCNMEGTIEVTCYSDSVNFSRLALMVKAVSDPDEKGKVAKFYLGQGNEKILYVSMPVTKAGYYQIMLGTEDTFRVKQDESIPYLFYYKFTPKGAK